MYDVPRSNRRVEEEAIYANEGVAEEEEPYDVPRLQQQLDPGAPLDIVVPPDYDVPKVRDSLSTIEEEEQHHEYER